MMLVDITPETCELATIQAELSLPKWMWKIIIRRADALHQGDLGACLGQLLTVGFQTEIRILGGVNKNAAAN